MSLVTTAQVKVYLPHVLASSTSEDAAIAAYIGRAEAAIAQHCGYPPASAGGVPSMASASRVRYLDGEGGRELVLDVWPVTAIASIYDDPEWTWGASTLVASTDYTLLEGHRGLVILNETSAHGAWSRAKRAIKATVTAGFVTAPDDLVHAIGLLVATYHKRRPLTGVDNQSTADGARVEMEKSIPKEVRDLLGPYLLPGAL